MSPETTSSACISPITIKPEMKIKTLSDQDLAKIHQATLTVLNETGVRFPSEKALKYSPKLELMLILNARPLRFNRIC